MRLVFLGLSLSSSWGNGHATTYRALLAGLAARGHQVMFLEREQPWYAAHRDLRAPGYCALEFYESPRELGRFAGAFPGAAEAHSASASARTTMPGKPRMKLISRKP